MLIDKMDGAEKLMLDQWLETNGQSKDDFVDQMARGMIRCCDNWDGFMEVSDVMHSDWGFKPKELDDQHASKPMLVVGSTKDRVGGSANNWLVDNYKSARLKSVPGGHISSLYYMDEIWRELISCERATPGPSLTIVMNLTSK